MDVTKTSITSFSIAKHVLVQNKVNVIGLNSNNTNVYVEKVEKKVKTSQKINISKPKIRKNENSSKKKYIVIIDPGHGGKDPGAIGSLGTLEKRSYIKSFFKIS